MLAYDVMSELKNTSSSLNYESEIRATDLDRDTCFVSSSQRGDKEGIYDLYNDPEVFKVLVSEFRRFENLKEEENRALGQSET